MRGKERILSVIEHAEADSLPFMPITMMFAADFAGASYGNYVKDHRVLVQAQLRVAEAFDIDHVSCISDPAREAADCGASIEFFPDQPPALREADALLRDKTRLARLNVPDPHGGGRMFDRVLAAALFREHVGDEKLIEGWIEGPCAEAADLRGINALMMDFYEDPGFVRDLLEFVLEMEIQFARAQIEAGVDLMGIGDAAASLVGSGIYHEFVLPYQKRLIEGVRAMGGRVRLHICGNTQPILEGMRELPCDIIDLDYPVPLKMARAAMGPRQVLCGNIAPVDILRNGAPETVLAAAEKCYQEARPRFILGAGCEVPRDTPHENLRAMSTFARSHRP